MGFMKKALAVSTMGGSLVAEKVIKAGQEDGWTTPMYGPNSKKALADSAANHTADGILWHGVSREQGRNAQIRLYADRIEREKPGTFSKAAKDNEVIPVRSVTSVNIKKANMIHSDVVVMSGGGAIPFRLAHKDAQSLKDAIMPLVLAAGQPQMIQSQESASDKLLKLAQLRDASVLSDDEFQAKRAALINLI